MMMAAGAAERAAQLAEMQDGLTGRLGLYDERALELLSVWKTDRISFVLVVTFLWDSVYTV